MSTTSPFVLFDRVHEAWQKRGAPCSQKWIKAWIHTYVSLETFARNIEKRGLSAQSARDRARIARERANRCADR